MSTPLAQLEGFNQWLDNNPLIVVLMLFVLGGILIGRSMWSLYFSRSKDHPSTDDGGRATAIGIFRLIAGIACTGFAIYKLING